MEQLEIETVPAKKMHEIHSIDDILGDFTGFTDEFPIDAVNAAIAKKDQITPQLLEILQNSIDHFEAVDNFSYLFAMFLLAEFKEKRAFPLMLDFILKANDNYHELLVDKLECFTHNIMGSVYDGNINALKKIIEDESSNLWAMEFSVETLLVLVQQNVLNQEDTFEYLNNLKKLPRFQAGSEGQEILKYILEDFVPGTDNDDDYEFIQSATEDLYSLFPFEENEFDDEEELDAHEHHHGPNCQH